MPSPSNARGPLQPVDGTREKSAISGAELSARDYSADFHSRVIARFVGTQSLKQTARDFNIPARVLNEILHLANYRRPMARAASAASGGGYGVESLRRSA